MKKEQKIGQCTYSGRRDSGSSSDESGSSGGVLQCLCVSSAAAEPRAFPAGVRIFHAGRRFAVA